jgi:hypothetical protein
MQAAMPMRAIAPGRPQRRNRVVESRTVLAIGFIALNGVLAIVMRNVQTLATAHAVITVGAGLAYAATTRRLQNVAFAMGYIVGCEVLWRMCKFRVFWELGKYGVVGCAVIALARVPGRRNLRLAALFFGLLIPSTLLTLEALGPSVAREQISFTLAGPLALAVCVVFFSNIRLSQQTLRLTFVGVIAPVFGILVLAILRARTLESLDFENGANSALSGGFGPNQVSAAFGLATFFLFVLSIDRELSLRVRIGSLVLAGAFAIQSALTFARGGLVLALVSGLVVFLYLMGGSAQRRISIAVVLVLCSAVGRFVIVPRLDEVTGGKLSERYSNTKTSGRNELAESELGFFFDNPVLGVGPGVGTIIRQSRDESLHGASHTEYTRLIGEHGILGILALICLLLLAGRALKSTKTPMARALALSMLIWGGLYLAVYSTRNVAPSLAFGLAFAAASATAKPKVAAA